MPPNPGNNFGDEPEPPTNETAKSIYEEFRPKNEPLYLQKIRDVEKALGFVTPLIWKNITNTILTHVIILTWLVYNLRMGKYPKWQTVLLDYSCMYMGIFGVTGGVHRYWSHRSFKANVLLQWILAICFVMSGQNSIFDWVRDHRVHHKFSDKSADPHDPSRGLFFSHMGWLMMMKHPDVSREGRKIDLSDVKNDYIVQFNKKYYFELKWFLCYLLPMVLPPLLWGESWDQAVLHRLLSIQVGLHFVLSINSLAHRIGYRPYDPKINPSENWFVSLFVMGEGWHNYHHAFPWDYKAAELPHLLNPTTLLLDGFAALGWANNLKQASTEVIQATIKRTHKTTSSSQVVTNPPLS